MYRIRNWKEHFENANSRKCRQMLWVPIPTKHDGLGFRKMMKKDPMHYTAWVLMLTVAAKCPDRGTLADENGALDGEDLELKTGLDAKHFNKAFSFLVGIGWLET